MNQKRRVRANNKATTKYEVNGRCINQITTEIGKWANGEIKLRISYIHVTKGKKYRILPPLFNRVLNIYN